MITPEPPAGSEHYREGWRHGYEQAAIDRERPADAVRPDTGQADEVLKLRWEVQQLQGIVQDQHRAIAAVRSLCADAMKLPTLEDPRPADDRVSPRAVLAALDRAGSVPDTGQAREPGYERIAEAIGDALGAAALTLGVYRHGSGEGVYRPYLTLARVLDKAGLIDWAAFHEPSGDTVQAPAVAALAYARSEVDKWLADNDPYCILPTRTEHIPALLARLDELEGTR